MECVRLRTFGKYGVQQMQVDAHYLQIYLWRYVTDEQLSLIHSSFHISLSLSLSLPFKGW